MTLWQVVDYLLNKAKDSIEVNAVDDTDKTALHHAARRRRKSRFGDGLQFFFWVSVLGTNKLESYKSNICKLYIYT